jgi:SAM-dependent methyltransferase
VKTLDEIGIAHQTDKASQFSRTYAQPHDYLRHLERFFEPMRDKPIKLVEIGIGGGESARTWLEYFPNAIVYGVDLVANTNEWNTEKNFYKAHDRYTFRQGDQSKQAFWKEFITMLGGGFNIIIDDGSHYASDMKAAFTSLWHHLKSGGLYVVEDLNFDSKSKEWLEGFIGHIHGSTFDIDSIYFARELCVMRKK